MHVLVECGDVHQHKILYYFLERGYQEYNSSLFLNKQIDFCINNVQKLVLLYHDCFFFYLGIVVFPHLTAHLVSIILQLLPIGLPAFCFYLPSRQTQEQLKSRTKNKKCNIQLMIDKLRNDANPQKSWVWTENNFVLEQLRGFYLLLSMFNSPAETKKKHLLWKRHRSRIKLKITR